MSRPRRNTRGGYIYHILNRGNDRKTTFQKPEDYRAFERVWREGSMLMNLPLLSYCLMPNHWHMIVFPPAGEDDLVSQFFQWVTMTHSSRYHHHYGTVGNGHLYPARFKSFPVECENYLYHLLRYVERNAQRANLVTRAEEWPWSSLWKYYRGDEASGLTLTDWPVHRPNDWLEHVNAPQNEKEVNAIARSMLKGTPYGSESWVTRIAKELGLEHTLKGPGRPPKKRQAKQAN